MGQEDVSTQRNTKYVDYHHPRLYESFRWWYVVETMLYVLPSLRETEVHQGVIRT